MKKASLIVLALLLTALAAKAQYIPPAEEDVRERIA